jgi:hypothetical protein
MTNKPKPIDPALRPFLDAIAEMITARLLAEHHERQHAHSESANVTNEAQEIISTNRR